MKLSVQLYTVRDACRDDPPGTLSKLAAMGLRWVELAGLHGRTAGEWRALLDALGLRVSASHVGLGDLEGDMDRVIGENRLLGNAHVVVGWLPPEVYASGWARVAERLVPLGRRLGEAGLTLSYHNHSFEFALEDGKAGLDRLYDAADPSFLKAQIDTYWVYHGGQDPAAYIRWLGGRIPTVHFKDGPGEREGVDAEAGKGALNWDDILAASSEAGVEVAAIEMDNPPREPFESVKACVDFFRAQGVSE